MPVSVRDIARHAAVSNGTVSRVLNGHEGVNPELRARVLHSIEVMGYDRPPAVRTPLTEAGFLLVVRDVEEERPQVASFWAEVLYGAELEARAGGVRIVFRALHSLDRSPDSIVEQVRDLNLKAALVVGPAPDESVKALTRAGLSLALVDNAVPEPTWPAVLSDNFGGTRAAVEHLLSLGHRDIAFIGGPSQPGRPRSNAIHSIWWRALGYRTALEENDIAVRPELIENCDLTAPGGAGAARRLLKTGGFTAVVAANDPTAVGVLQAFTEQGIRVPGDISVVGFDDDPSFHVTPQLTTVHVDTQAMGSSAVRLLAENVRSAPTAPMICTLPVQLVVRGSTGPAPGRRVSRSTKSSSTLRATKREDPFHDLPQKKS